jgi:hypothetical protein
MERAVLLTVPHVLFVSGSDRAADRWREDYAIAGVETLDLHHLRCLKDVIEERLFAHRRDPFTRLDLVFLDATSLYFEGAGGQTLGR